MTRRSKPLGCQTLPDGRPCIRRARDGVILPSRLFLQRGIRRNRASPSYALHASWTMAARFVREPCLPGMALARDSAENLSRPRGPGSSRRERGSEDTFES